MVQGDIRMDDINDWGMGEETPVSTVTLQQMDDLVKQYAEARSKYDEAKAESNKAHAELQALEGQLVQTLSVNGKTSYNVDGVGSLSVVTLESYKTPKDAEAKKNLFKYIQQKYGQESLTNMLSIHSATLNSWANQEAQSGVMSIPGLDQPTVTESLRFRRK
jgi:hypothetical protein